MTMSMIFGTIGFLLAAYSVIGNDSAQTLGTFISSNSKKVKWYWMWAFASVILTGTLLSGWAAGDIAFGRLDKIPLPKTFQWYHCIDSLMRNNPSAKKTKNSGRLLNGHPPDFCGICGYPMTLQMYLFIYPETE